MIVSNRPPCPLTMSDVQAYIRSKRPEDVVGTQHLPASTLLAEVWYFIHGLEGMAVVRPTGVLEVGQTKYELSDELWQVHLLFERLPSWGSPKVTRATWTQYASQYWHKIAEVARG